MQLDGKLNGGGALVEAKAVPEILEEARTTTLCARRQLCCAAASRRTSKDARGRRECHNRRNIESAKVRSRTLCPPEASRQYHTSAPLLHLPLA